MKIQANTIARTICLALALINQCLAVAGKGTLNFVEADIYQLISLICTVVTTIAAWWKNNSFTKEAVIADNVMKKLKSNPS